MKAQVDKSLCVGCGLCTTTVPEVFELGADGKSQVLVDQVPAELEDACREARDGCPVGAISLAE